VIIADINDILTREAKTITDKAGIPKNLSKLNEVKIALTRRYLGYGARYLKYKREGGA
jgi:hypothetical protein